MLVMAVCIMAVLMAAGSSLIFYANSNSRSAEYSVDEARALNLAEAGMNYARSILWNAANPTLGSSVPAGSLTLEGGTATYVGTYNSLTQVWTLTGTGTYANPTAGGSAITRSVSSDVALTAGTASAHPSWAYNYSDALTGCLPIGNATFNAPLYARGNLCIANNGHFTGSSLHVGGTLTVGNNGSVGYAVTPIPTVNVVGGCTGGSPNPHACVSGPADAVYDGTASSPRPVGTLTKPTVDLAYWYQNASPGPLNACTVGSMPGGFDSGTGGTAVPPNPEPKPSELQPHALDGLQLSDRDRPAELDAGEPGNAHRRRDDLLRRQHDHAQQRQRRLPGARHDLRRRAR